jgi:hypothetical protein
MPNGSSVRRWLVGIRSSGGRETPGFPCAARGKAGAGSAAPFLFRSVRIEDPKLVEELQKAGVTYSGVRPGILSQFRVPTANGPGMIQFRPDGRYAFVPSRFTPELDVIDVARHEVVARVEQASPFSPNLAVSPDGKEVWFTLKDTGKAQVIAAEPPFATLTVLDTGPVTNHVAMVDGAEGHFAYVTVGGLDLVKVYRRNGATPEWH